MNPEQREAEHVAWIVQEFHVHIRWCDQCVPLVNWTPDAPAVIPTVSLRVCPIGTELLKRLHDKPE